MEPAGMPGTPRAPVAQGRRPPGPPGQQHHDESAKGSAGCSSRRGTHSGRGLGVIPRARQREVREDAVNDGGVVDGDDQFHTAGATRTA